LYNLSRLMKKSAQYFMCVAFLAMLFQVFCPLFLSIRTVNDDFQVAHKTAFQQEKHSVNAPALLKEQDENETETRQFEVELVALIDFSALPASLSEFHNCKITPFICFDRIDHRPPLFTLNSVFRI
jgi:hypothetical protein